MPDDSSVTVETLKGIAAAFNQHNADAIMEFFAEDCTMDLPRGLPLGELATPAKTKCVRGF